MATRTLQGTVKVLNLEKGFGFIAATDGRDYFFHRSAIADFGDLRKGDAVQFTPGNGEKGPRAEAVERC